VKASAASRLEVKGTLLPSYREILTNEALQFVEKLEQTFGSRRIELLELRKERERRINEGEKPSFLKETEHIRKGDWTIPPVPKDLQDRRVEITGPVDRKMIINALKFRRKSFYGGL